MPRWLMHGANAHPLPCKWFQLRRARLWKAAKERSIGCRYDANELDPKNPDAALWNLLLKKRERPAKHGEHAFEQLERPLELFGKATDCTELKLLTETRDDPQRRRGRPHAIDPSLLLRNIGELVLERGKL